MLNDYDNITLNELRAKIKDGSVSGMDAHGLGRILARLFRSKEFSDYWQSYVKISPELIQASIDRHNPNPKQPVVFYCIAGGAVGNLMYSYLMETEPVLNDVDVFCWAKGEPVFRLQYEEEVVEQPAGVISRAKSGSRRGSVPERIFTGIVREDMLNIIYQSDSQLLEQHFVTYDYVKLKFEELIKEFDYNVTMAFWTPQCPNDFHFSQNYVFFIKEQVLKIFGFQNPLSTIARGVKKSEELNVRFEKNKVIEVMAHLFNELDVEETHLGEKKKVEFRNNPKMLEPWFKYDDVKGAFLSQVAKPTFSNYTQNKSKVFAFFKLSPWQREQLLFLCENGFFQFRDMYFLVSSCQVNIPQYNKKQVEKYKQFMKMHHRIKIHPNQINEWLPFIKKCVNVKNQGLIGYIENHLDYKLDEMDYDHRSFYKYQQSPPDFLLLKQQYEKELREEFTDILTNPIEIPDRFKQSFEELVSRGSLKLEGLELDHCVGGYYSSVKNGRCKIFKIRSNEEKATLEVMINQSFSEDDDSVEWRVSSKRIYLGQVRGVKNCKISEELFKVVNEFIEAIEPQFNKESINENK